jgi:hypothetical protein
MKISFSAKIASLLLFLTFGSLTGSLLAADSKETITEEIVVTGDRDNINLQLMVDQAEDQFFAIFNDLVDEDFRIECKYEKVLGSLIKQRVCQTGYMKEELTTAATFNFFGMEYGASAPLAAKNTQMRELTIELLQNNSELRSAALNLSERVEEYRDEYGIPDDQE